MPSYYTTYVESLAPAYAYVPTLLAPRWPSPLGVLDLYGAHRLSVAVNWIATDNGKSKRRASMLQEVLGILIVLFGGETFLCMCTGQPPSWLLDPSAALVWGGVHVLQTRTPLIHLLPSKPNYAMELALSIPDAIGRTLLLTRFSVVPLLHPVLANSLPATPSTLLLVPFILAVPFGAIIFSGTNFFTPDITLQTPMELRAWGWCTLDAWLPIVLPAMFLSLIGPVDGWPWGLDEGITEDAAIVLCGVFVAVCFLARTWYNLAPKASKKAAKKNGKKVKKA